MSITCLCDDPLESVQNEKCDVADYGNQVVKIFGQKETGTDFDGTVNNSILVEADWDEKLAADDDTRIVVFPNLSDTERPSSEPNKETGNQVPYGGEEIIDRPQIINAAMKYVTGANLRKIDQVACWPLTRFWFLDNNNWLWAFNATTGEGIPGASFTTGTYQQMGIGTKNRNPFNVSWNNVCQPVPVAKLSFLRTKSGSNVSGSTL